MNDTMNLSRSLCFGAVLTLALPSLATATELPCASLLNNIDNYLECANRSLTIAERCRTKLGLPKVLEPGPISSANYIKLAECEETAAKTESKIVADELREFARVERKHAKPGVSIGMTMQQVVEETSWGVPRDKNRTTTAAGTSEQWVYGRSYLYFDNGILISIQN